MPSFRVHAQTELIVQKGLDGARRPGIAGSKICEIRKTPQVEKERVAKKLASVIMDGTGKKFLSARKSYL